LFVDFRNFGKWNDKRKLFKFYRRFFQNDVRRVRAAALIGSFGRGEGSSKSDIDIELLINENQLDVEEFQNDVKKLFENQNEVLVVKHLVWLREQRKLALYHGFDLLLTELYLYTDLSQFDKYFLGSRIKNLDRCVLVDRENILRPHFEHILTLPYDNRSELLTDLIGHIQFLLESTSTCARRSDSYKFYFLSNIALHELVRLSYVLNGEMEYNYNPPNSVVNPNLSSTMDLTRSHFHLKKLIELFLEQIHRLDSSWSKTCENVEKFCEDLFKRDSSPSE